MNELTVGPLTFTVEYRDTDEDRGPALRVFADVEGKRTQLLRFDCFEDDPHYHYDPTGKNVKFHLDRLTMGCPVEFTLKQLSENLPVMIEKAGFAETSARVSQPDVVAQIDELKRLIKSSQPA